MKFFVSLSRAFGRPGALLLVVLAMTVSFSCDDEEDNYLAGSLTKSFDFNFDYVRARLYESELSIEYVDKQKNAEQVALRVTLKRDGTPLAAGETYDLLERGTVGRGAGYASALPELESGSVELKEFGSETGSHISGEFKAVFLTDENTKQTLRGGFSAELEVVEF